MTPYRIMPFWTALLSRLSCLCGFNNEPSEGSGEYNVELKVKNKCCNGKTVYHKSITLTLPEGMTKADLIKILDDHMDKISNDSF
jgi:hypothetical protein